MIRICRWSTAVLVGVLLLLPAVASASSEWSLQSSPNVKGAVENTLLGVSCSTAGDCAAVGYYTPESLPLVPLAQTWNGGEWVIHTVPEPEESLDARLRSASCSAPNKCMAVGDYDTLSGEGPAFSERWSGTAWSLQEVPKPKEKETKFAVFLEGVSCLSASECTAVGKYAGKESPVEPVIYNWNGVKWALAKTPILKESGGLSGVSCTSATACLAVGGEAATETTGVPLVETWNGTAWSAQKALLPAGAKSAELTGVSCANGKACIAVGFYESTAGEMPLAESWNGTTWTVQTTLVPKEGKMSHFTGVSCSSSTT